jgi:hypothetical protein
VIDTEDLRAAVRDCRATLELLDGHLTRAGGLSVPRAVRTLVELIQVKERLAKVCRALGAGPGNGEGGPGLFDRLEAVPADANGAGQGGADRRRRRRPGPEGGQ